MTITVVKMDVTTVTKGVVAHGVNCQGKMNSGVAKAIRAKWPAAFEKYEKVCTAFADRREELLGLTHTVNVGEECTNDLFVANCFTQLYYGYENQKYADIKAVDSSLAYALAVAVGAKIPLYMPRIGCGLGGLNWDTEVGPVVDKIHAMYDFDTTTDIYRPQIYVCDWS